MIKLGWKYGSCGMVLRTLRTRLFHASDRKRWTDLRNHDVDWDTRTRAIAALVPPGSHVIELSRPAPARTLAAGRLLLYAVRHRRSRLRNIALRSQSTAVCQRWGARPRCR